MTQLQRRTRDPVAVRTTVLDAALELFAQHGFADTSLRDISRKSGVAHPLILHHFGSKESLYAEVKRRVVEGYAQRFPAAARAVNRPINLRAELRRIMTYVGENELALRLCARTRVDGDYQVWPGEPNLFDLLERRMKVAQEQGLLRDDLDPRQLSVMIMGIVFFWLENRKHFAERFGKPLDNNSYLNTAIKMIEEGLLPRK
ncbi:MAG: TetR/AcrR family transcriptional regulator [Planctomycetaceae bacterium]|nr:TetR/AcrR family transcriptional regulator [Planctomycetaceae bacterium]